MLVSGKHVEQSPGGGTNTSHFNRQVDIPSNVDLSTITSSVSPQGVLTLESRGADRPGTIQTVYEQRSSGGSPITQHYEQRTVGGSPHSQTQLYQQRSTTSGDPYSQGYEQRSTTTGDPYSQGYEQRSTTTGDPYSQGYEQRSTTTGDPYSQGYEQRSTTTGDPYSQGYEQRSTTTGDPYSQGYEQRSTTTGDPYSQGHEQRFTTTGDPYSQPSGSYETVVRSTSPDGPVSRAPQPLYPDRPNMVDTDYGRKLQMTLDIGRNLRPDDIAVTLMTRQINVVSTHTQTSGDRTSTREITREFELPERMENSTVIVMLDSAAGILYIGGSVRDNSDHNSISQLVRMDMPPGARPCRTTMLSN